MGAWINMGGTIEPGRTEQNIGRGPDLVKKAEQTHTYIQTCTYIHPYIQSMVRAQY